MKKQIITIFVTVFLVVVTLLQFGAWDNTLPADNSLWNNAAGEIRDNNDALEAIFGVDLLAVLNVVDVRNFATFELAITDIGSTDATLLIPDSQPLDADTTVPENVTLWFTRDGLITVATGQTLTILGEIEAGTHAIFSQGGTGKTVLFSGADISLACEAIQVAWFGVFETDIGLSTTKAIASLSPTFGGTLIFPNGDWDAITEIDCTASESPSSLRKNVKFTGGSRGAASGSRINIKHEGIGFNCVGAKYITFDGFTITGDTGTTPDIGILFARAGDGDFVDVSVGITNLNDMNMWGVYDIAAIYNYGSELDTYVGCRIQNNDTGTGSAIIITKDNDLGVTSSTQTIKSDGNTNYSSSKGIVAFGCTFASLGDTSKSIIIRGGDDISFRDCFFICGTTTSTNNSNIFIDASDASMASNRLVVDGCRFEIGAAVDFNIHLSGSGSEATGFRVINNLFDCDTSNIFTTDTKINGGTIAGNTDNKARGISVDQLAFMFMEMENSDLTTNDFIDNSFIIARKEDLLVTPANVRNTIVMDIEDGGMIRFGDTARTATTGGATTGLIDGFTNFVVVTCDDATKQITLPVPYVGRTIIIVTDESLGCELIPTLGVNVKINNVTCTDGASLLTKEAALLADSHYTVTCVATDEWTLVGYDAVGAHATAIIPDAI